MKRFWVVVMLLVGTAPSFLLASDCTDFIHDYKEGNLLALKKYERVSEKIYLPGDYCSFSGMTLVTSQDQRAEFYTVEQCAQTHYQVVKTTLLCVKGVERAEVNSRCDVQGRLLTPCLKKDLAEILAIKGDR